MPQIRVVHSRRVSLCLDRDSRAGIDARAGNYAAESKRLLESDCSMLSLNRTLLCARLPAETGRDAPNSGCSRQEGKHIRLSIDRLVCPKRSSRWQSISSDSCAGPLPNSAEFPDAMDPERGSVGSGAVVALCRTVAGRVPVWKCHAGKESAAQRWWERCSWKDSEVQCRTGAFWGNQGLTGASRFRGLLPALTAQFRAAALRCCARCSPLYWLLPAKTQLPPYGGLRESELKCLRSHPTPLRFYPQALSGAPALS